MEGSRAAEHEPIGQSGPRMWHPGLPAVVFLLMALLIPVMDSGTLLNADGDPARHLRQGSEILTRGDVIRVDRFSFTKPGAPFVGFEYGSQVLMAMADRVAGLPGVVVLFAFLISGTLALTLAWLLRGGVDPLLALVTTILVTILSQVHWLARPHVFSWPLILGLLAMLEASKRPKVWWFGALFVLWANVHGAFLFGWILIGLYFGGGLLTLWAATDPFQRAEDWRRVRALGAAMVLAVAATFLTPYGWRLPAHLVSFFADPYLRDVTQEFLSPNFHAASMLPFLMTLTGVMFFLALRPAPSWPRLLVLIGSVGMALVSRRNIVFFAQTGVLLLALELAPWWERAVAARPWVRRFGTNARTGVSWPYLLATTILLLLLAANRGMVAGAEVIADRFDARRFPVAAVTEARDAGLEGRIFHEFTWGGYILYAWPEQKVFIDGGTDFYGSDLLKTHQAILGLTPGWRDSLDVWRIDLALLRADSPLAAELGREPGWETWHRDTLAVLLRRNPR
jgi:hypothetical protein